MPFLIQTATRIFNETLILPKVPLPPHAYDNRIDIFVSLIIL
jgi:hypothetical protein